MYDSTTINDPYTHTPGLLAVDINEYMKVEKIQKTRMCMGLVKVKWLRHDLIAYRFGLYHQF